MLGKGLSVFNCIIHCRSVFYSSKINYLLQILVAKKGGTARLWLCWITKILCQTSSVMCIWIMSIIWVTTWLWFAKDSHCECGIAGSIRDLYLRTNLFYLTRFLTTPCVKNKYCTILWSSAMEVHVTRCSS